jgi:hypothetical protein
MIEFLEIFILIIKALAVYFYIIIYSDVITVLFHTLTTTLLGAQIL